MNIHDTLCTYKEKLLTKIQIRKLQINILIILRVLLISLFINN